MKCPECNRRIGSTILETRTIKDAIRRRRECIFCGGRFTTHETISSGKPDDKPKADSGYNDAKEKL